MQVVRQDSSYRDAFYQWAILARYKDQYKRAIELIHTQLAQKPSEHDARKDIFRLYYALIRGLPYEEVEPWRSYWIYFDSVKEAFTKLPTGVKVMPFVQGFDYRVQTYDENYVFSQMNGVLSAGGDGFMIWNARSDYSTCWRALEWARNSILRRCALMNQDNHMKATGHRCQDRDLH